MFDNLYSAKQIKEDDRRKKYQIVKFSEFGFENKNHPVCLFWGIFSFFVITWLSCSNHVIGKSTTLYTRDCTRDNIYKTFLSKYDCLLGANRHISLCNIYILMAIEDDLIVIVFAGNRKK